MISKLKKRTTNTSHILFGFVLSLLIHFIFFASYSADSHKYKDSKDILQVRFIDTQPHIPERLPLNSSAHKPSPSKAHKHSLAKNTKQRVNPVKNDLKSLTNLSKSNTDLNIGNRALATAVPNQQAIAVSAMSNAPPNWAEIEFDMYEGTDHLPIGKATQHYEVDTTGHYQLNFKSSIQEPNSHDSNKNWLIQIEGNITSNGLHPLTFVRQGKMAESLMSLKGNNHDLAEDQQNGRMPDGILDRVSMLYQFMHLPPTDSNGNLWLTDGRELLNYSYQIIGTEPINIGVHDILNATHLIINNSENSVTIDIWLALDSHYLPLKVIYKDSQGKIIELAADSVVAR